MARAVKYLEDLDATGREAAAQEEAELAELLTARPSSLREGRTALAQAVRDGGVGDEAYVQYMSNRVARDDYLMRHASGALHERQWPPLR